MGQGITLIRATTTTTDQAIITTDHTTTVMGTGTTGIIVIGIIGKR
jgi:hypothetical protein